MSDSLPCWPIERIGEAIEVLADRAGYLQRAVESPRPPARLASAGDAAIARFVEHAAEAVGIEADAVDCVYADAETMVRRSAPALLRIPGPRPTYLAVARVAGGRVHAVSPELLPCTVPVATVVRALALPLERDVEGEIEGVLDHAAVQGRARARARGALLSERLRDAWVRGSFVLALPPGVRFSELLGRAAVPRLLARVVLLHAISYGGMLLAWWMVGRAALSGRVEPGWLAAWALLLLSLVPLRALSQWYQGRAVLEGGALLKQRLLAGALRLDPEEIRHQGAGQLFGRVAESEAVERLAVSGGLDALMAIVELALAAAVLALGAVPILHPLLLVAWLGGAALVAGAYAHRRARWSETRISMTNDLVERMVGHRTRVAQEAPERWHDGEDQALALYHERARELDRGAAVLLAFVSRGWLLLGLVALMPAFVAARGEPESIAALAISAGGLLLSFRALSGLSHGVHELVGARIAWREVLPLFDAAARPVLVGRPEVALLPAEEPGMTVIDASDLVFGYPGRGEPVIRGCNLRVALGDRVLVQGSSGGGKTTLAALLTGLRAPQSGLVLLRGLDRQTAGASAWARGVAAAPQFHENHVMSETLAFNLLMGRTWPPAPDDFARAEALCGELGLGELLARMPAGMLQMVGDTGWQLSHGERSRIFIARALLQDADLVVLDESFAALDPENLRRAMQCVLDHARSVLVIAHP